MMITIGQKLSWDCRNWKLVSRNCDRIFVINSNAFDSRLRFYICLSVTPSCFRCFHRFLVDSDHHHHSTERFKMSLAEELLADLEDDDDAEVEEDEEDVDDVGGENVLDTIKEEDEEEEEDMDADGGGGGGGGGEMDVKPKVKAEKSLVGDTRGKSIHAVAKLSGRYASEKMIIIQTG